MDDHHSDFSSIENQVIGSIPERHNINDIQSNFSNDFSLDKTSSHYSNSNNNYNPAFLFRKTKVYYHQKIEDSDDSSDEYISGYSPNFLQNLPFYKNSNDNNDDDSEQIKSNFNKIHEYKNNQNMGFNDSPIRIQNFQNFNDYSNIIPEKFKKDNYNTKIIHNYQYHFHDPNKSPKNFQISKYNSHTQKNLRDHNMQNIYFNSELSPSEAKYNIYTQNIHNYNNINYNISPQKFTNSSYYSQKIPISNINYNSNIIPQQLQNSNYKLYLQNIPSKDYSANNNISYITPQLSPNYENNNYIMNQIGQGYSSFSLNSTPQKSPELNTNNFKINEQTNKIIYYQNNNKYNINKIHNLTQYDISSHFSNNINLKELEPVPQDTIIEDDHFVRQNNNINKNLLANLNNINTNFNLQNNLPKNQLNLEELFKKCRKNGTPPPDSDFSHEKWTIFYPPNEKFFLWDKGRVIPNQLRILNENDDEKLQIYQGEVNKNDEFHGYGIMITPKFVRKGTWRDGEFTGWGRESRVNGDIYEGKFIDGAIFGQGINKSRTGNLYIGNFVDNRREGKGELRTKRIHYIGEFKNNQLNGKGKIKFLKEGHSYKGNFMNNEITGFGVFKWSNGDIYEGEMKNGVMNGYGKYVYKNGQIYEGNYLNGKKHGLGKMIYKNNKIYEGEFKNGKPGGEGVVIVNGKKIELTYKNGKFHKK